MYIPEFWSGVVVTILCEVIVLLLLSAWATLKKDEEYDIPDGTKEIKEYAFIGFNNYR